VQIGAVFNKPVMPVEILAEEGSHAFDEVRILGPHIRVGRCREFLARFDRFFSLLFSSGSSVMYRSLLRYSI
jgi:hypothetical protein